jgi:hypothetical protein
MSFVALIGAVIAAIWAVTGASLGRVYNRERKTTTPEVVSPVSPAQSATQKV